MNKFLNIFIIFIFLNISYQLECSQFIDDTCGGHNIKYNLICHKFSSGCTEVEIDDECQINESHQCVSKNELPPGEKCIFNSDKSKCKKFKSDEGCKFDQYYSCKEDTSLSVDSYCTNSNDVKYCQKFSKTCQWFSDATCGGLEGITGNTQCTRLASTTECYDVQIDSNCKIDKNKNYQCSPIDSNNEDDDHKCYLKDYTCKLSACADYKLNECQKFSNKCFKVQNFETCRIVTVADKCTINNNGICTNKQGETIEDNKICDYNSDYTKCELRARKCDELGSSKCSTIESSTNVKCKKIRDYQNCREVIIHDSCEVDNNGKCKLKNSETQNKGCIFKEEYTECQLIDVDSNCLLNDDGFCNDNPSAENFPYGKKCALYKEQQTKCGLVDKECSQFSTNQNDCERKKPNKKCSWFNDGNCQEYTSDQYCHVVGGTCQKIDSEDNRFGTNEDCLFDYERKYCSKKSTIECTNYFENCQEHSTDDIQCIKLDEHYCQKIKHDEKCIVNNNSKQCDSIDENDIPSDQICDFDNSNSQETWCKLRIKKCKEYTDQQSCNEKNNCAFLNTNYYYGCYDIESDNFCSFNKTNGINCDKKTETSLNNNEKCSISYNNNNNKAKCGKINKSCGDYTDPEECYNSPRTDKQQCVYYGNKCQIAYLDGNCYIDQNADCVENGSGKLSKYEKCDYTSGSQIICGKIEKTCSSIQDNTCNSYQPNSKLCFKFDDQSNCKEVKVDDQCKINDKNECTGNGCRYDENNDRCYYKSEGNNSFIKMKSFIFIALLFIF